MRVSVVVFFVFIFVEPRIRQAQAESPGDKYAVGGDVGILATTYGDGSAREPGDTYLEYHITPRASVRGLYEWAETDPDERFVRRLRVDKLHALPRQPC